MAEVPDLLRMLAETETALTRETEAILAGAGPDESQTAHKLRQADRLTAIATVGLAETTPPAERQQLRRAFERMLDAAGRNEAVLSGALRGIRLVTAAEGVAVAAYPGQRDPTHTPHATHLDRLA